VLLLCVLGGEIALAHWTRPEDIVAGLRQDAQLRDKLGVFDVYRDKRLLVIQVLRARWDATPDAARLKLAQEWRDTWRHNVPGGIVAVVDATNDDNLVHYDGNGHPHLIAPPASPPEH
jgi:hypothetical protein